MPSHYDVAVVGAGIVGLAHAYHLAKRGLRVVVLERHPKAQGASVRNFGMLWSIGQPAGDLHALARRSVAIWREVLGASRIDHDPCGSLHLAYHDDEAQILAEFIDRHGDEFAAVRLSASEISARYPAINPHQLRSGMFTPNEINIDARQTIATLPDWLHHTLGVDFVFGCTVRDFQNPRITTTLGEWSAPRIVVCTGVDFRDLAPQAFATSGLFPCKLQMMRSQAYGDSFRVGTMLAAGLTLRHYRAFADCPTLPALCQRLDRDMPEYHQFGIHVLLSQNARGEFFIGDTHEYGNAIEPFDKPDLDELILRYLRTMVTIPSLHIAARWHGIYIKHPTQAWVVAYPQPGMMAVTGLGGNGMTLSFGVAERLLAEFV